jgi:hypothetical protein
MPLTGERKTTLDILQRKSLPEENLGAPCRKTIDRASEIDAYLAIRVQSCHLLAVLCLEARVPGLLPTVGASFVALAQVSKRNQQEEAA